MSGESFDGVLSSVEKLREKIKSSAQPTELPVSIPEHINPSVTVGEIISHIGRTDIRLDPAIQEEVTPPSWYSYESNDTMGTRTDEWKGTVQWVFKDEESGEIRIPQSITIQDLLSGGRRGHVPGSGTGYVRGPSGSGGESFYGPILLELGLEQADVANVKAWIEEEKTKREYENRRNLENWFEKIERQAAYHCLSLETQRSLQSAVSYGTCNTIKNELPNLEQLWGEALVAYEMEKEGEILVNWTCYYRSDGSNQGHAFVIQPDGVIRVCDQKTNSRDSRGTFALKVWEIVLPGEAALVWTSGTQAETAANGYDFKVNKKPSGGFTSAQLQKIIELQEEAGDVRFVRGGWGIEGAPTSFSGNKESSEEGGDNSFNRMGNAFGDL